MKRRIVVNILRVCLILGCLAMWQLMIRSQASFNGSRVKGPEEYYLNFTQMNMGDSHSMELKAGDTLTVNYDIQSGNVSLLVGVDGQEPIYRGNGLDHGTFTLVVPEDGEYVMNVDAKKGSGVLDIRLG